MILVFVCFFIARLHFLLLLLSFVRSFIHSLFSFHVLPFDLVVSQLDSYVSFQSLCLLLFWMDTMLPCNASSYVTEVICLVWCMYMLCTLHGCNFYLALRGDRSSTHATRASDRLLCMGCILFFILLILFQESSENSFCWRIQINTQQFILRFDTRAGICRHETVWSTHTHTRTYAHILFYSVFLCFNLNEFSSMCCICSATVLMRYLYVCGLHIYTKWVRICCACIRT